MKLTPLDIKRQEFKNTFRGYDPMEVETFLEMVADEYEELANERTKFREEILTLQTQLKDYQQVEQTLKQTLMNAQESVNRARVNTEKEANLIIHEAELKAERFLEKSRRDLETMKNELMIVRAQKESFAKRLKHLLESQIELIEVLEIDDSELGTRQVEVAPERTPEEVQKKSEEKADEVFKNLEVVKESKTMAPDVETQQELEAPEKPAAETSEVMKPEVETPKETPEILEPALVETEAQKEEQESTIEEQSRVDLLKAESVPVSEEIVGDKEPDATNKLEEFLQKKEEEDLVTTPTDFMHESQKEPAVLNEILDEKDEEQSFFSKKPSDESPKEKSTHQAEEEISSSEAAQPTSLEEFFEDQSKEHLQIPEEPVEEKQTSLDDKKEKLSTQSPVEPDDLFRKLEEDQGKKKSYPDDDQMIF